VRADVEGWFRRRTSAAADWPLREVLARKGATRVSVVLPALDEEATVGRIVEAVRRDLVEACPLVDEVVVVDSGSTDATAAVAAAAGARVVHRDDVLPALGSRPGKGEVLWKSLAATEGDVVVFVDADLTDFASHFVTGLVGPLLADPGLALVKGCYERPLGTGRSVSPGGGGRVTELVARPLLGLHWPELAGVVQPLAGEYAGRRAVLEALPFTGGYGVEVGLLVDVLEACGLDAIAQVDLGRRSHRHQDDAALGRMASAVAQTVLDRLVRQGRLALVDDPVTELVQFTRGAGAAGATAAGRYRAETHDVAVGHRPPIRDVPGYRDRHVPAPAP